MSLESRPCFTLLHSFMHLEIGTHCWVGLHRLLLSKLTCTARKFLLYIVVGEEVDVDFRATFCLSNSSWVTHAKLLVIAMSTTDKKLVFMLNYLQQELLGNCLLDHRRKRTFSGYRILNLDNF